MDHAHGFSSVPLAAVKERVTVGREGPGAKLEAGRQVVSLLFSLLHTPLKAVISPHTCLVNIMSPDKTRCTFQPQ